LNTLAGHLERLVWALRMVGVPVAGWQLPGITSMCNSMMPVILNDPAHDCVVCLAS